MSALSKFFDSVFEFESLPEEERRKRRMAIELAIWIALSGIGYNLTYVLFGFHLTNTVSIASVVVTFLNIFLFYLTKNYNLFRYAQLFIILIFGLMSQVFMGGFVDGSAVGFCAILPTIGALIFADKRTARIMFAGFIIGQIGLGVWEYLRIDQPYHLPREVNLVFFVVNFTAIGAIIYFIIESFFAKINAFQKQANEEKEKSEKLLLNILPAETARELKETGKAKAHSYASATIVFTDFVGFSTSSRYLTPQQLVEELDIYFQGFDNIIEHYGLEKIKTVGDAYMCVGGLPSENNSHALDAVRAACDMVRFVEEKKSDPNVVVPFDIRIGIHTGPVVAGIVGRKKFVYDIWGEAVNIAARMEQNAVPGHINISESTYFLVSRHVKCSFRGKVNAKNMGDLNTYLIDDINPPAPPHLAI